MSSIMVTYITHICGCKYSVEDLVCSFLIQIVNCVIDLVVLHVNFGFTALVCPPFYVCTLTCIYF